jgi:hypothetical protein
MIWRPSAAASTAETRSLPPPEARPEREGPRPPAATCFRRLPGALGQADGLTVRHPVVNRQPIIVNPSIAHDHRHRRRH